MKVKISSLLGNSQLLDGGAMYGNAPRAVWEKWSPPDSLGRIDLACRAMLIEWNDKKILLETGIGNFFEPKMAERFGVQNPDRSILIENLKKLNISASDIDYVILSHLHFDHAGGLLPSYDEIQKGNEGLRFPNAKIIVGREAWERALKPHSRDRASFIPGLTEKLEKSGRLRILEPGKKYDPIAPILDFFISEGHTPGQMLTILSGETRKLLFAADLIPGVPWLHIPITMGYDRFPELLIDEKEQIYSLLKADHDMIFFTHDPNVAAASFHKDAKGRITAAETWTELKRFEV